MQKCTNYSNSLDTCSIYTQVSHLIASPLQILQKTLWWVIKKGNLPEWKRHLEKVFILTYPHFKLLGEDLKKKKTKTQQSVGNLNSRPQTIPENGKCFSFLQTKTDNTVMAAQVESRHDNKEFFQWILREILKEILEIVDVDVGEEPRKASLIIWSQVLYNCCNILGSANKGMFWFVDYSPFIPTLAETQTGKMAKSCRIFVLKDN